MKRQTKVDKKKTDKTKTEKTDIDTDTCIHMRLVWLSKNYYHTVTNAFATNIIVGDQTVPGMESIFALQPPH